MKIESLLKSGKESANQKALFAWAAIARHRGFAAADAWAAGVALSPGLAWANPEPRLEWLYAVPNGGARGDSALSRQIRGAQLKAEGVKAGVPDIFLPVPIWEWNPTGVDKVVKYCGLYIELKRPELKPKRYGNGGLSNEQMAFAEYANANGYLWVCSYGWREAANAIKLYLQ